MTTARKPEILEAKQFQPKTGIPFDFGLLPENVRQILEVLRHKNKPFWLVGGFTRDWAAGIINHRDIDISAQANVYALHQWFGGTLVKCRHPHILRDNVEILPSKGIRDTLENRDFTVNAMAIDANGYLIDPWNGAADARNRLFRMISTDTMRVDPIRIARGCRLAARLGWQIEEATSEAMAKVARQMDYQKLARASGIKIAVEFRKALDDARPSRFFRELHRHGALALFFPELEAHFRNEEKLAAILDACDNAPHEDYSLRMLALLKDIAPPGQDKARQNATAAMGFLERIRWNNIASDFGRAREWLTAQGMASIIRRQNVNFRNRFELVAMAISLGGSKTTFSQYARTREIVFGDPIPQKDIDWAKDVIGKMIANPELDEKDRERAAHFLEMKVSRKKRPETPKRRRRKMSGAKSPENR